MTTRSPGSRLSASALSVLASLAGLAILACSGGTTGVGSSGGTATQSEDGYCAARADRLTRCLGDAGAVASSPSTRANCSKDYRCALAIAASPDAYFACRAQSDCAASTSDDTCLGRAGNGTVRPESDTCAKKYATCKSAGGKSFDDDICPTLSALRDDVVTKLVPCFDKACAEVGACLDATVKGVSADCD